MRWLSLCHRRTIKANILWRKFGLTMALFAGPVTVWQNYRGRKTKRKNVFPYRACQGEAAGRPANGTESQSVSENL